MYRLNELHFALLLPRAPAAFLSPRAIVRLRPLRLVMPCFRSATPSCFKHADTVSDSRFGSNCPFCAHFKPPRSPPPTGCRDKRQDSMQPRLRGAAVGQTHVLAKDVRRTMCKIPGMRTSCRRWSWRSSIRISVQGMAAPTDRAYCRRQEGYRFIKQIVARASSTNERGRCRGVDRPLPESQSVPVQLRPPAQYHWQLSVRHPCGRESHAPACSITAADRS